MPLSAAPYGKKSFTNVRGKRMAHVETGQGSAIVFQHGNPTSSYLWRNVMPHCEGLGRLIACDLIGMGESEKLEGAEPERYSYQEHRDYLFAFWDSLAIGSAVVLVLHDWGSVLGFEWAQRNPDKVRGIVYMEGIVQPLSWDDWPEDARRVFQAFRSESGEELILDKNIFVERVLPGAVLRDLTDQEMSHYRAPFAIPGEDRRPTLSWPRHIPVDGTPGEMVEIVAGYADWLALCAVPKLFINADPGSILTGRQRDFCRTWPNQTEVTVNGSHFIQEDSPDEIGTAIAEWIGLLR